jgi:DNA repair protein RecO (recombination protein O)
MKKTTSRFDFLEAALLWLDNHDEMANFHLI